MDGISVVIEAESHILTPDQSLLQQLRKTVANKPWQELLKSLTWDSKGRRYSYESTLEKFKMVKGFIPEYQHSSLLCGLIHQTMDKNSTLGIKLILLTKS